MTRFTEAIDDLGVLIDGPNAPNLDPASPHYDQPPPPIIYAQGLITVVPIPTNLDQMRLLAKQAIFSVLLPLV